MAERHPFVTFIVGPTASGKSDYAYRMAQERRAVIISCDSMQIYREPEILTNKPPQAIRAAIKHEFIDIVSVKDIYNAYDYSVSAARMIGECAKNSTPVIVCGGTGMYMKALLDGIFQDGPKDDALRKTLEEKDARTLRDELKSIDPLAADKISANDKRRLVRALEVYRISGVPISVRQKDVCGIWGQYDIDIVGLKIEREKLYERINQRTEMMFTRGVIEEAKRLLALPLSPTAKHIMGLKEISSYLNGDIDIVTCKESIKQNTRRYAKRQMTWFNKDKRVNWINV